MHLPAMCVSFMHNTSIVDQYMHGPVVSFTMYCIVHGFMGMCKGMWCGGPVFLSVQVFWLIFCLDGQRICSLILPPCVLESLSMTDHYDVTLLHQITFP